MSNEYGKYKPFGPDSISLTTATTATITLSYADFKSMPEFEKAIRESTKEYPVTLDLDKELLGWISRIITSWAVAEWIQQECLVKLLGLDRKIFRALFKNNPDYISKISDVLQMRELEIPKFSNVKNLQTEINECAKRRNLIGHGIWINDEEAKRMCVIDTSGTWKFSNNEHVSKRKYPEAFYPEDTWFTETFVKIKFIIEALGELDKFIISLQKP